MSFVSNLGIAFQEIVRQYGNRTALLYPATGERVDYSQLSRNSVRIASILQAQGLRQGQVAAMFHDKSPAAFAAMLACIQLGITYTNLDPESPWERVSKILDVCRPDIIINGFSHAPFAEQLEQKGFRNTLHLREINEDTGEHPPPDCRFLEGSAPAYIMFTSGSTGIPKGAVISHANLLWFTAWARDRFSLSPDDVLTNVNPVFFDNSVFDFYSAIYSGATLVPITPEQLRDTRLLVSLIDKACCTIWFSVPSLLVYLLTTRSLTAANFANMRKIIFGGEGFPKTKLRQLFDLFGSRVELENVYGPTECTCICSAHKIGMDDFEEMQNLTPLGFLAQNFGFEILPLDKSEPDFGELLLRGPQVGLGYYNDPDRTAKSFIQNPCHSRFTDVAYRTGDLVYKDARGWLHFKGRADFQIKHMGYRIELEEIEAALNSLPNIKESAVIYKKLGDGLGQIIAFVATNCSANAEDISSQMAKMVPGYMMPKRICLLEHLPKNANGKIDRISLLTLDISPSNQRNDL
ncbi:MAG: AMP-binding protein [Pseudomonadota bacterium]